MKTIFYPAAARGHVNFGWLDSHHSFSFGHWYDPAKVHFGALRVLNDDVVQGGAVLAHIRTITWKSYRSPCPVRSRTKTVPVQME